MTLTPEWLEHGALGLLGLLLVVIGYVGRELVSKFMERQKVRDNHAAEVDLVEVQAMVDRMNTQDGFMRQLIVEDRQDRNDQQRAMVELVAKDIEAKTELVTTLQSLCDGQKALVDAQAEHDRQADERHARLIEVLGQFGS